MVKHGSLRREPLLWKAKAEENHRKRYQVIDYDMEFQYLTSFNWVIAQYTPAPFPQQAQNFWEECFVILIILSCLPLLGSEIAKVSGTVNLLTEKAFERLSMLYKKGIGHNRTTRTRIIW